MVDINGIIMVPASCRLSCCLYCRCAVWCVELGMRHGGWWSLIMPIKICDQGIIYVVCGLYR
jgi:hypothetical protein